MKDNNMTIDFSKAEQEEQSAQFEDNSWWCKGANSDKTFLVFSPTGEDAIITLGDRIEKPALFQYNDNTINHPHRYYDRFNFETVKAV